MVRNCFLCGSLETGRCRENESSVKRGRVQRMHAAGRCKSNPLRRIAGEMDGWPQGCLSLLYSYPKELSEPGDHWLRLTWSGLLNVETRISAEKQSQSRRNWPGCSAMQASPHAAHCRAWAHPVRFKIPLFQRMGRLVFAAWRGQVNLRCWKNTALAVSGEKPSRRAAAGAHDRRSRQPLPKRKRLSKLMLLSH